GHAEEYGADTL
nr:Chain C, 11MER PEPTIDE [Gallus gallus]